MYVRVHWHLLIMIFFYIRSSDVSIYLTYTTIRYDTIRYIILECHMDNLIVIVTCFNVAVVLPCFGNELDLIGLADRYRVCLGCMCSNADYLHLAVVSRRSISLRSQALNSSLDRALTPGTSCKTRAMPSWLRLRLRSIKNSRF